MNAHPFPGEWHWWASFDGGETMTIGPCDTSEQAIDEASDDGQGDFTDDDVTWHCNFTVMECLDNHIDLAKWFEVDRWLDSVGDQMEDNGCGSNENGDHHPLGEIDDQAAADLQASIHSAIRHWQTRKGLKLRSWWFLETRNSIDVCAQKQENMLGRGHGARTAGDTA